MNRLCGSIITAVYGTMANALRTTCRGVFGWQDPYRTVLFYIKMGLTALNIVMVYGIIVWVSPVVVTQTVHGVNMWIISVACSIITYRWVLIIHHAVGQWPPFSIIQKKNQTFFYRAINQACSSDDMAKILAVPGLFHTNKYELDIWVGNANQIRSLRTHCTESWDDPSMLFQASPGSNASPSKDAIQYAQFIKRHRIIYITPLTNQACMTVSCNGRLRDIQPWDEQQLALISEKMAIAISNQSMQRQYDHSQFIQNVCHRAISSLDPTAPDAINHPIIHEALTRIIPETSAYYPVDYDADQMVPMVCRHPNDGGPVLIPESFDMPTQYHHTRYDPTALDADHSFNKFLQHTQAVLLIMVSMGGESGGPWVLLGFNRAIPNTDDRWHLVWRFLKQVACFWALQKRHAQISRDVTALKAIVHHAPIMILTTDDDHRIRYVNAEFCRKFDQRNHGWVGTCMHKTGLYHIIQASYDYTKTHQLPAKELVQLTQSGVSEHNESYYLHTFQSVMNKTPTTVVSMMNMTDQKKCPHVPLHQSNRLMMINQLVDGISDELTIPINHFMHGVSIMNDAWHDHQFQHHFEYSLLPQVNRINLLCNVLLRMVRLREESTQRRSLVSIVDDVKRYIQYDLLQSQCRLCIKHVSNGFFELDDISLTQALISLIMFCSRTFSDGCHQLMLCIESNDPTQLVIQLGIDGSLDSDTIRDRLNQAILSSIAHQIIFNQGGSLDIIDDTIPHVVVQFPLVRCNHSGFARECGVDSGSRPE